MARRRKPNGNGNGVEPCRNCREFKQRIERGGGTWREAGGSHVVGYAPNGDAMTAYYTNGKGYPRGIARAIGKWLAAAGLVLALAVAVGCM